MGEPKEKCDICGSELIEFPISGMSCEKCGDMYEIECEDCGQTVYTMPGIFTCKSCFQD
jgi:hypothetical protein